MSLTITDHLRAEIVKTGLSASAIAIRAGIHPSIVARFLNGSQLTSHNLDALVASLNIEWPPKESGRRGREVARA